MRLNKWIIGACFAVALAISVAQTPVLIHISQMMSPTELRETGVDSLSEKQRAALDVWFNQFTARIIRAAATTSGNYIGTGKHFIDEVDKDGAIVILEDDSVWEVESTDRIDTSLWLETTDITVSKDPRAIGEYKYILRNTEDHETAHAKYQGDL